MTCAHVVATPTMQRGPGHTESRPGATSRVLRTPCDHLVCEKTTESIPLLISESTYEWSPLPETRRNMRPYAPTGRPDGDTFAGARRRYARLGRGAPLG